MTVKEFTLPDVGEGVAEGELVAWLVEPGDRVTEDQPVAEVETDKALVEVPSPYDGTVRELRAEPGDVVPVGEVIITFDVEGTEAATDEDAGTGTGTEGDERPADAADRGRPVPAPPSVRRLARELDVDLAAVDGSGPGGRVTKSDVRAAAGGSAGDGPSAEEATAEEAAPEPREVALDETESAIERREDGEHEAPAPREPSVGGKPSAVRRRDEGGTGRDRTLATPATRGLAAELGVDIDEVPTEKRRDGSPYVTAEQVRAYAEREDAVEEKADAGATGGEEATESADETAKSGTEEATAAAVEAVTAALAGGEGRKPDAEDEKRAAEGESERVSGERVPYRGVRRAIGEQMERAKFTAPHVTHHDEVAVSRLVETRAALNEVSDVHLTYVPFVLKAVVSGLTEFPYVNARLDEAREEIVLRDEYNVGVATATDSGLMVPVIENVDEKGVRELAAEVAERTERARDRSITRSEMQGGTFTVTNVGAIGGEYATPIVNHPEVAILALGSIRERPWVEDGEVVARHTLPVSLSVDHRVVDGAVAARFTNHVTERLSRPEQLLL